jgi:hypothetical protein
MPGKKILLFTGAGTSIRSKLPCTSQITESLLNGSWRGQRDLRVGDRWVFLPHDKSPKSTSDPTDLAQQFLKLLKLNADEYYALRTGRESNYEDLYYLVRQICEDAVNTVKNPAIGPFIDKLKLRMLTIPHFAGIKLKTLASWCCSLIYRVVLHELKKDVESEGFKLVHELATNPAVERFDICTLNHDSLIEH